MHTLSLDYITIGDCETLRWKRGYERKPLPLLFTARSLQHCAWASVSVLRVRPGSGAFPPRALCRAGECSEECHEQELPKWSSL